VIFTVEYQEIGVWLAGGWTTGQGRMRATLQMANA
jgi:hypothetical protein